VILHAIWSLACSLVVWILLTFYSRKVIKNKLIGVALFRAYPKTPVIGIFSAINGDSLRFWDGF
jgi:hypothetical protein